jgi:Arc/MetJ-type ribon-helix-helix transcriptional regulator
MARSLNSKRDFSTRLSPRTLEQLDDLVRRGRFKTRTEALEAAVEHLHEREGHDPDRLRAAFERACGALSLGIDRAAWRAAERDRLEWESGRDQ